MNQREVITKLRDCAKGLMDVARELQRSERIEPPRTLEIVERQIKSKVGAAHKFSLPFVLGVDEFGNDVVLELARLPHVLVGGATGQGKTECLNSLVAGLIATKTPDEVRFVIFDPKCVEYVGLAELPHLMIPVVTSAQKMLPVVRWLESEVDKRLRMFAKARCRNISDFNSRVVVGEGAETLPKTVPYIVAVFDEFADLMHFAGKEIEPIVCRLTALARAAGVHLVIATGRPDAKVVTGAIKANVPGRVAFMTANSIDSRTLIDDAGAESLFGLGDFMCRVMANDIIRGQGAYVSYDEIANLAEEAAKSFGQPNFDADLFQDSKECDGLVDGARSDYDEVVALIRKTGKATVSHFQRCLGYGYNHASELMDRLESNGLVGPAESVSRREIFWDKFPME